jgi:hypothetical protein
VIVAPLERPLPPSRVRLAPPARDGGFVGRDGSNTAHRYARSDTRMENVPGPSGPAEGPALSRARALKLSECPRLRVDELCSSGILREGRVAAIGVRGVRIHLVRNRTHMALVADGCSPQLLPLSSYVLGRDGCATRTLAVCACGRRVASLYLRDGRFACRRCGGKRYNSDDYELHERLLARMDRLARLVGGGGVSIMFPPRPRFMRRAYYTRLEAEYHALDEQWNRAAFEHLFDRKKPRP